MKYRQIEIIINDESLSTKGTARYIDNEIKLKHFQNIKGELSLLYYLIDYILDDSRKIYNNETINYGLWLLKFVIADEYLEVFELDELFEKWSEGADNAIYYIEMQKSTCSQENTIFSIPLFTQKIAISKGVLEGGNVYGIRYQEPNHMSGWYLVTEEYDKNIKSLSVIEMQTLVIHRKDLLQFLALPPGFIFETYPDNKCFIKLLSEEAEDLR